MDNVSILRFILSFCFVIGLLAAFAWGLKRYSKAQALFGQVEGGRLAVVEMRYLDPKRKLVLVRRDGAEHLLLLADGREMVVESNIGVRDEA